MNVLDPAQRMAAARIAQTAWAALPVEARASRMRPFRRAIAQRLDEIVQTVCEEVGKPPMDALTGDVMVALEQLRYYERRAGDLLRSKKESKPWFFYQGASFVRSYEPHGTVLVFAPWNYPFQLSVVPMATALFAGNAVLLKCSEHAPRTARLIQELCDSAGLTEGLVQVSCEAPEAAGALIDAHPDFVFFTGSGRNGRAVAEKAASLMVPTIMELGGKDAAIVFDSCDLERTANGIVYGSFSNAGQVCVGTKRIYVQQSVFDKFLAAFLKRVGELRAGSTIESDIGPVRMDFVRQRLLEQVEEAVHHGATLHAGSSAAGNLTPFVLTGVSKTSRLLREESFGPVVCMAAFQSEEDAIREANASPFQLSASVWTGDRAQGSRVASRLGSGSCAVNDVIRNIGNPACAFGGNRASGHGRYHGAEGLYGFSRVKTVMTMREHGNREVHWFPFQTATYARLRKLLLLRHGAFRFKRAMGSLGKAIAVFAYLGACAIALAAPNPGPLAIDVTLPPGAHGQIAYLVFSSADGFPGDRSRALRHDFVPLTSTGSPRQTVDVGLLPPGNYAVTVYLDENEDRKLNSNWLGIPKEPVGASNNPRNRRGPPRFNECVFQHGSDAQTISITLVQ